MSASVRCLARRNWLIHSVGDPNDEHRLGARQSAFCVGGTAREILRFQPSLVAPGRPQPRVEPRRSAHQGCQSLNLIIQPGTKAPPLCCTQSPLLRVVGLKKTYATPQGPLAILKGIDFSLNSGSSLALMDVEGDKPEKRKFKAYP